METILPFHGWRCPAILLEFALTPELQQRTYSSISRIEKGKFVICPLLFVCSLGLSADFHKVTEGYIFYRLAGYVSSTGLAYA